jgi:hypothetical protein
MESPQYLHCSRLVLGRAQLAVTAALRCTRAHTPGIDVYSTRNMQHAMHSMLHAKGNVSTYEHSLVLPPGTTSGLGSHAQPCADSTFVALQIVNRREMKKCCMRHVVSVCSWVVEFYKLWTEPHNEEMLATLKGFISETTPSAPNAAT